MSHEPSLGAFLRRGRQRSGLSVEDVAAASRIGPVYIRALEADRHGLLPAAVYVRGFIRAYCGQVGVDADAAVRRYEACLTEVPGGVAPPSPGPGPRRAATARRWVPILVGTLLIVLVGFGATLLLERAHLP